MNIQKISYYLYNFWFFCVYSRQHPKVTIGIVAVAVVLPVIVIVILPIFQGSDEPCKDFMGFPFLYNL